MGIFMVQGSVLGVVGNILGILFGLYLAFNVESIVSSIEEFFNVEFLPSSIYYISKLPSDPQLRDVLIIGIGAFLITLLVTLYPAWRASRVQPAEALRYE